MKVNTFGFFHSFFYCVVMTGMSQLMKIMNVITGIVLSSLLLCIIAGKVVIISEAITEPLSHTEALMINKSNELISDMDTFNCHGMPLYDLCVKEHGILYDLWNNVISIVILVAVLHPYEVLKAQLNVNPIGFAISTGFTCWMGYFGSLILIREIKAL